MSQSPIPALLAELLQAGHPVRVEGLGTIRQRSNGEFELYGSGKQIFIAYVEEDLSSALRLYDDLRAAGFQPWIDKRKLLPGQNWARCLERAIARADFVLACFSSRSIRKRGQFQTELRLALEFARRRPLDEPFPIPVRLEECRVPGLLAGELQWVDLFPNWREGLSRLIETLRSDASDTA